MRVIITFTFCCDNLWKSKFMALEKPGKLGEFFLLFCGQPGRKVKVVMASPAVVVVVALSYFGVTCSFSRLCLNRCILCEILHGRAVIVNVSGVILARNKPVLLQQSLLEKVLPFAVSPMSTVLFKLLGTLRMAVDGQSKNFLLILTTFNTHNSLFLGFLQHRLY